MVHGIRRYLLIPRTDRNTYHDFELNPPTEENMIASLNANRHILFGAQLNITNDEKENNETAAKRRKRTKFVQNRQDESHEASKVHSSFN